MKVKQYIKVTLSVVLSLMMVITMVSITYASRVRVYEMEGRITAIDLNAQTVVVNVPMGRKNIFTVAGPLAKDAVLKRDHKKATLAEFRVGERVLVAWVSTYQGHLIKRLELR